MSDDSETLLSLEKITLGKVSKFITWSLYFGSRLSRDEILQGNLFRLYSALVGFLAALLVALAASLPLPELTQNFFYGSALVLIMVIPLSFLPAHLFLEERISEIGSSIPGLKALENELDSLTKRTPSNELSQKVTQNTAVSEPLADYLLMVDALRHWYNVHVHTIFYKGLQLARDIKRDIARSEGD